MQVVVAVQGLNLEKLLREAAQAGVILRGVRREGERSICARVSYFQMGRLRALAERFGWKIAERSASPVLRVLRALARRWTIPAGAALCVALVLLASRFLLVIHVENAGKEAAAVRSVLQAEGIRPGRLLSQISTDALRARLEYALPGLTFAGVRIKGSVMEIDCRAGVEGETAGVQGDGVDVIAARDGIVTHIWASSGTPQVTPGQAVTKGQVLIAGYEWGQNGDKRAVEAQGEVRARVWSRGEACTGLGVVRTQETGRTRRRATLVTPLGRRTVRSAESFATQDISTMIEPVVGLFLPVYREIEILAETRLTKTPRSRTDAMAIAQGAAEQMAKNNAPAGSDILDKSVDYSMIDDEFVYAVVVLEYETDIAARR
ncbi:MAG: sporulation protein YqfD [Clostridia bacterium]|nr:sporulation protein YqfD [Clostridia bacterium]